MVLDILNITSNVNSETLNKFIETLTNKFGTLSESKNLSASVVKNSFRVVDGLIDIIGKTRLRGVNPTSILDNQVQK